MNAGDEKPPGRRSPFSIERVGDGLFGRLQPFVGRGGVCHEARERLR